MKSGLAESIPYSLSRWTDLPHGKWGWMREAIKAGWMFAFDPRTGVPDVWSLKPEDTLGLVYWTKDPRNLVRDHELLRPYRVKVHVTITGWTEVEHGAPKAESVIESAAELADLFGVENLTWRFSPVPLVEDALDRFVKLARPLSQEGFKKVFLSFIQPNDRIEETRSAEQRIELMKQMASAVQDLGVTVLLCNEDRTLLGVGGLPGNLCSGVCAPPEDWSLAGRDKPPAEGCGCVLMADPFNFNESCTMGCEFCYAADKTLSPKKRNSTRGLPVIR